jgi:prepilin-type N-terminal cleavage/methylation domain-containing protein
MLKQELLLNAKGFTLVEIIAVMVILGVLAAVAVPRYVDLEDNARNKCIQTLISEINARESLTWADHKISTSGFVSDLKVFNEINYNLDPSYTWHSGDPSISGGIISFKGESFTLSRRASSPLKAAIWKLK